MSYRIVLQPRAQADIEAAYQWLAERSPASANRWYNGLVAAIDSLQEHPERCPLAPEADAFDREIRQLLYGKRRNIYRVLFVVEGDTSRSLPSATRPSPSSNRKRPPATG